MLYAAKCYWPGVTQIELDQVAARAAEALAGPGAQGVTYRGSLLFANDDLVLCLFDGPSPIAIKRVSDRAGIPCERIMDSVWLGAGREDLEGANR